jgi:hypothetical protein
LSSVADADTGDWPCDACRRFLPSFATRTSTARKYPACTSTAQTNVCQAVVHAEPVRMKVTMAKTLSAPTMLTKTRGANIRPSPILCLDMQTSLKNPPYPLRQLLTYRTCIAVSIAGRHSVPLHLRHLPDEFLACI